MKCENCNCDTYVIHISEEHQKLCTECYENKEIKKSLSSNPQRKRVGR